MYSMRFDMRAPDFGASPVELYEAAVDMCEWAETRGCLAAVICEHHGSPDGYLPTPLILGSAVAARTKQLMMTLIVILPFYDPVRLAEEIAVLDLISKGRAGYVFGLGYRPEEYQHFGLDRKARGRISDEKLGLLRRLLAGEVVEQDGRRIKLTPLPFSPQGPLMMWGGGSLAAARRAGRYGLGYLAQGDAPGSQQAYEEACRAHGHEPGMTLLPNRDTPSVCFVAPDVDVAWQELGEHLLHDARIYAEWNPDDQNVRGYRRCQRCRGTTGNVAHTPHLHRRRGHHACSRWRHAHACTVVRWHPTRHCLEVPTLRRRSGDARAADQRRLALWCA
jgi:alkanesulfonate monooxygenase SsuD/methylene tetrahydromethanopterin reductase-like flavin-dependent oxidoreductase (luciferase family)